METKYLVTKDIIYNIEGFNTTITAYFKQEMFLYSHSHDRYYMYNLLTIKGYKFLFKGRGRDCNQKFLWWPFTIEGCQRMIFWKIELGAQNGCT